MLQKLMEDCVIPVKVKEIIVQKADHYRSQVQKDLTGTQIELNASLVAKLTQDMRSDDKYFRTLGLLLSSIFGCLDPLQFASLLGKNHLNILKSTGKLLLAYNMFDNQLQLLSSITGYCKTSERDQTSIDIGSLVYLDTRDNTMSQKILGQKDLWNILLDNKLS